jgi:hypothetical protein
VWENTPAKSTRALREAAAVHSHVAHCAAVLEDKWALALVQDLAQRDANSPGRSREAGSGGDGGKSDGLGLLPTHCLRGKGAVAAWCARRWGSSDDGGDDDEDWWVLKDAEANGAGGVWVLSQHRWRALCGVASAEVTPVYPRSPLHEGHRYVAQRYVGCSGGGGSSRGDGSGGGGGTGRRSVGDDASCGRGLALWRGRKCHVRCCAVVTGDLGVWVQRRAFLHVANKPFDKGSDRHTDDEVVVVVYVGGGGA